MSTWAILVAVLVGGAFAYAGARLAPRWIEKPVASWETYLVAAIGALLAGLLAGVHGLDAYFWQQVLLVAILVTAALVDIHARIIPNELVLFGLAVGVAMLFVIPYPEKTWIQALLGGLVGFGSLAILALLVRGGMGLGDVKLSGIIGLFLGLNWVGIALIFAFLSGGFVGLLLLLFRLVKRKDHIPFGPYLAFGGVLTALYGLQIWHWYIGF